MNAATATKKATKQELLNIEAMELFAVKTEKMVQTCLYALGFRQECGRCGGSGRFSYCQQFGDRCFGCAGQCYVAMKLTRAVLDEAAVKVAAGDLVRIREIGARKIAARKSIAGLVEAADAIYSTISDAYTVGSRAARTIAETHAFVLTALFYAQGMNNGIFHTCIKGIEHDVKVGNRKDFVRCVSEIQEATEMLTQLRDAWIAFDANKEVSMEDAERAIYGALLSQLTTQATQAA